MTVDKPLRQYKPASGIASLTLILVSLVAILMALITMLDIRRERSSFYDNVEKRGVFLGKGLNDIFANHIYHARVDALRGVTDQVVASLPDIDYVSVLRPDGSVIVDRHRKSAKSIYIPAITGNGVAAGPIGTEHPTQRYDRDNLVITSPLEIDDELVGTVRFAFDPDPLGAEIKGILWARTSQSSALMALGITLAFLISRKVTQPLKTLAASAERIGYGNLEEPVPAQGTNETKVLGHALERMRVELRELYIGLEIKVAERTQEISDINQDLEREIEVRKLAEAGLRESERILQSLVNSAAAGIISVDDDGMVQSINPAAETLFGYRPDEIVGRSVSTLMTTSYRDEQSSTLSNHERTAESTIIDASRELEAIRKDGTVFPIELAVGEVWSGGRKSFTGIITDVTERKLAEEERANHALALEAANKELEAFSYSVSHDLRAPLRSINGFSQALLDDCSDELGESGRHYLHRVKASSERMAELIDDLLQLSRITRSEMKREQVDLSAIAGSIAAAAQRSQPERQVQFDIAEGLAGPRGWKVVVGGLGEPAE